MLFAGKFTRTMYSFNPDLVPQPSNASTSHCSPLLRGLKWREMIRDSFLNCSLLEYSEGFRAEFLNFTKRDDLQMSITAEEDNT